MLDPSFSGLLSDTPKRLPSGEPVMEMEWEVGTSNYGITDRFPTKFWPWPGDRVWMLGRWVFDCGHYDTIMDPTDGSLDAINFTTEIHPPTAVAFTRQEPVIFPGDNSPSVSSKTYIYMNGLGGYYDSPVPLAAGDNYEFDVPLPPKPSPNAQPCTAILELLFGDPQPTITIQGDKSHVVYRLMYLLFRIIDLEL